MTPQVQSSQFSGVRTQRRESPPELPRRPTHVHAPTIGPKQSAEHGNPQATEKMTNALHPLTSQASAEKRKLQKSHPWESSCSCTPQARPNETHNAPRGRTTASSGTRPGVLTEPEAQEAAVTVGFVAAAAPLLAQPVLGGVDTLDTAAVQFLLAQSLLERKRKEEEEEEREVKEEAEKKAVLAAKKAEEQRMPNMDATIAESLLVSEEGHADWPRWSGGSPAACSSARSGKYKRRKRKKTKRRTRSRRSRVPQPGATTSLCSCSSAVLPVVDPEGCMVWLLMRPLLRNDRWPGLSVHSCMHG